jgi:DNA-binding transcriptional LysR family regulator
MKGPNGLRFKCNRHFQRGSGQSSDLLSHQLGFRLFERNHQIVDLTQAGRMFVEEAREAVLHAERVVLSAKAAATSSNAPPP